MVYSVVEGLDECDAVGSNAHYVEDSRRIVIRPGLPADLDREVLLHEVLHGVMSAANLDWEKYEDEERIVKSITGVLLDTLQRNPRLATYLLAKE